MKNKLLNIYSFVNWVGRKVLDFSPFNIFGLQFLHLQNGGIPEWLWNQVRQSMGKLFLTIYSACMCYYHPPPLGFKCTYLLIYFKTFWKKTPNNCLLCQQSRKPPTTTQILKSRLFLWRGALEGCGQSPFLIFSVWYFVLFFFFFFFFFSFFLSFWGKHYGVFGVFWRRSLSRGPRISLPDSSRQRAPRGEGAASGALPTLRCLWKKSPSHQERSRTLSEPTETLHVPEADLGPTWQVQEPEHTAYPLSRSDPLNVFLCCQETSLSRGSPVRAPSCVHAL